MQSDEGREGKRDCDRGSFMAYGGVRMWRGGGVLLGECSQFPLVLSSTTNRRGPRRPVCRRHLVESVSTVGSARAGGDTLTSLQVMSECGVRVFVCVCMRVCGCGWAGVVCGCAFALIPRRVGVGVLKEID